MKSPQIVGVDNPPPGIFHTISPVRGSKQNVRPEPLQISPDILQLLEQAGTKYVVTQDFASVIPIADAIYMTRIQDEWDVAGESSTIDTRYISRWFLIEVPLVLAWQFGASVFAPAGNNPAPNQQGQ